MRAILALNKATLYDGGLETLLIKSNAVQRQKCLTLNGLWLRIKDFRVCFIDEGLQARNDKAALNSFIRSHNHEDLTFSAPC